MEQETNENRSGRRIRKRMKMKRKRTNIKRKRKPEKMERRAHVRLLGR